MNKHTQRVLEYDKIRLLAASFAATALGRDRVASLAPSSDPERIKLLLRETGECMRIMEAGDRPPLEGVPDIRGFREKLGPAGSVLLPAELLQIAELLGAARRVKKFCERLAEAAPLFAAYAVGIIPRIPIEDAILRAVDEQGEVKDSASPALRKIRKQIIRTREELLDQMGRILQDEAFQKVVREPVITLRDDRYVLPLKPNFRQSLKGVVHGQSGSRATLFVEPLEVLERNNRLAELRMEERDEVERILRELTALVSADVNAVDAAVEALAAIDAVAARARFGIELHAITPEIAPDRRIDLRGARHPLLLAKAKTQDRGAQVTPNDITLDARNRVLIISGPNAGGKTVVLKTVGLLCLMAQSGLPVTAADGSGLPIFDDLFADIGDEQSLEADLSTFSSHVRRVAEILAGASRDSLVLLDELGSGTDPAEGAALGASVMAELVRRGCMAVVTTHHSSLKLFGSETPGAVNGAMEFDPESLAPTYRFLPGRPGRSYGLDLAERMGVLDHVVRDARSRLGPDEAGLSALLERIEDDSRRLRMDREQAERELDAARNRRAEAEEAWKSAREDANSHRRKAKAEAREVLATLRVKLRELSSKASADGVELRKETTEVNSLAGRIEPEPEPAASYSEPGRLFLRGERVRLPRLNKTGVVLHSHRGIIELEADGMTLKVPASEAVPAGAVAGRAPNVGRSGWHVNLREVEGLPDRLMLIGKRVDDAVSELDQFMDRAALASFSSVTIIHGLGTGALKTAVAERLQSHPLVRSLRPGEPAEGGAGVTVAELKK